MSYLRRTVDVALDALLPQFQLFFLTVPRAKVRRTPQLGARHMLYVLMIWGTHAGYMYMSLGPRLEEAEKGVLKAAHKPMDLFSSA